jgi:hypothetical protein
MQRWQMNLAAAFTVGAFCLFIGGTVSADEKETGKKTGAILGFWSMPKEPGAITVLEIGVDTQKTIAVNPTTIFDGICEDCMLPFKFRASDSGKNCAVCGCAVSNAQCMAGKPIKGTWQAMFAGLPRGVALRPTYNEIDKPESGFKSLVVDRHIVFLPVDGISMQTPEQLTALVKLIGGTKAELLNGGKHLTFSMKEEWTHATETKFEKALAKIGAKIVQPEQVAAAQ